MVEKCLRKRIPNKKGRHTTELLVLEQIFEWSFLKRGEGEE